MKLNIRHITTYRYDEPVVDSVNEVRLSPRTNYRQACYHHRIWVDPNVYLLTYEDFFGNRIHSFTLNNSHRELKIYAESIVVTHNNDSQRKVILSPLKDQSILNEDAFQNKYAEYLSETWYTSHSTNINRYAEQFSNVAKYGVYEWALQLASHIYHHFIYQPKASQVTATADDLLHSQKGVCQDFAHLMIAICRIHRVPARYVSGYHFVSDLQTRTTNFEQSSHAWVEVYVPGTGWLGFDPTNDNRVDERYIKLGHGRDYADIVPIKGIYRGTPHQILSVEVDVQRMDD